MYWQDDLRGSPPPPGPLAPDGATLASFLLVLNIEETGQGLGPLALECSEPSPGTGKTAAVSALE